MGKIYDVISKEVNTPVGYTTLDIIPTAENKNLLPLDKITIGASAEAKLRELINEDSITDTQVSQFRKKRTKLHNQSDQQNVRKKPSKLRTCSECKLPGSTENQKCNTIFPQAENEKSSLHCLCKAKLFSQVKQMKH